MELFALVLFCSGLCLIAVYVWVITRPIDENITFGFKSRVGINSSAQRIS